MSESLFYLFFIYVRSQASNLIEKETPTWVFFYELCEVVRNTFFLQATVSQKLIYDSACIRLQL